MIFFLASISQNANNQGIYDIFAPRTYHKKAEIKTFMIFLKSDAVRTNSFRALENSPCKNMLNRRMLDF